jgi:hypothetical protein
MSSSQSGGTGFGGVFGLILLFAVGAFGFSQLARIVRHEPASTPAPSAPLTPVDEWPAHTAAPILAIVPEPAAAEAVMEAIMEMVGERTDPNEPPP